MMGRMWLTRGSMNSRLSWIVRVAMGASVALAAQSPALAGDVSVSVNLATPGVYGQLTIGGDVPAPELIMPRPVVAVPVAVVAGAAPLPPLYLHVPPGHERHWAKHCREYDACGRPVYFVSDRWYNDVYTPRYRDREEERYRHDEHFRHEEHEHEGRRYEEHGHDRDDHHDHDHGHDHDHR
jgi:hypothetical protein